MKESENRDRTGKVKVLLIDDQPMIGEGVRRMLSNQADFEYHYCSDPRLALGQVETLRPTVILLELVLHQFDGLSLVRELRAGAATSEIPLVVLTAREDSALKLKAFAAGVSDYLIKLPDRVELTARLRHHSRGYENLLEKNATFLALKRSQETLSRELQEAARYVRSLLPSPLRGPVNADWIFLTSESLGGDAFGYHWLDENHFVFYLLDVCGHGVGAALLSVSAMEFLRGRHGFDAQQPSTVLTALNEAFPMEKQNDMYLAVWYGVFEKNSRRLCYASAGHPPAAVFSGEAIEQNRFLLRTQNPAVGIMPGVVFDAAEWVIPPAGRLYLFSDGAMEFYKQTGGITRLEDFLQVLSRSLPDGREDLERIKTVAESAIGGSSFEDDFSVIRFDFS